MLDDWSGVLRTIGSGPWAACGDNIRIEGIRQFTRHEAEAINKDGNERNAFETDSNISARRPSGSAKRALVFGTICWARAHPGRVSGRDAYSA